MKPNKLHEQLYLMAFEKWGMDSQIDMMTEECAELIVAINKFKRDRTGKKIKDICEELADVEIMLEQMYIIFNNTPTPIEAIKSNKLMRLRKRIGEES